MKLKSVIIFFLLIVFIVFNYTVIANLHLHLIEDGGMLLHSHPYDKSQQNSPVAQHSHTNLDFLYFSLFTIFNFLVILLTFLILFNGFDFPSFFPKNIFAITDVLFSPITRRGPPPLF